MTNEEFQTLVLQQLQALTGSVKALEEGQKQLTGSVKALEERQKQLTETVQSLEEGQKAIRKDLTKLETRMENEVIYKVGALFDGFSLRGDQIENLRRHIDERLDSIETDTRYLVARVARLEKLAK